MPAVPHVAANGAKIPAIGLGTWSINGQDCVKTVSFALKSGYRHIDTAAMYGNEAEVGEGLRAGGVPRKDIWVTTKVWWENIGAGALQKSAESSLKKLGLEQVDLLLIHWPNPQIALKESIAALCDAKRRGMAKNIGISNFTTPMIAEALKLTTEPIVCNQVEYHPRLDQSKVYTACREAGLAMVAYCPIGRGAVGGVMDDPVITAIAKAKGKSPAQVVLRWHIQQPGVVAIPKSSSPERMVQNLDVTSFTLSDDEMKKISGLRRPDGRIVNLGFAPRWDT
jgi:diketogulonate reductase-like aldo/keto reductase